MKSTLPSKPHPRAEEHDKLYRSLVHGSPEWEDHLRISGEEEYAYESEGREYNPGNILDAYYKLHGKNIKKAGTVMPEHIINGFLKRAASHSVNESAARAMLHKHGSNLANPIGMIQPNLEHFTGHTIAPTLMGGAAGALLGGLSGHSNKEEDDHTVRNALLGGLAGAGIGGGYGVDQYLKGQAGEAKADTISRMNRVTSPAGRVPFQERINQFDDVSLYNALMHPEKINKVMPPFSQNRTTTSSVSTPKTY